MVAPRAVAAAAIFAAIALSSSARAYAEGGREKMLVLEVRAEQGVAKGTANLLGEILVEDVHKSSKYEVFSITDMAAVLNVEQRKQIVGCDDASCFAEIGNALGADLILEGSVGSVGTMRVLALKIIDVRRVTVRARETETVVDDDALIDATHRLAAKLLGLPPPQLASSGSSGSTAPWFVLGGGGLLIGAGAIFGALALSDYHDFERAPFDDGLGDSASTKAHVADGLYAAGILTAAVGVIWLIAGGSSDGEATP